jgi:ribulose-phosphate 3-epimerase
MLLSPSILNSDFLNLGKSVEMLNQSQADWIHLDIMDGLFVPNISIGQPVIASIKKQAQKPLDVHLMIVDPDRYVESFIQAGASILTVQLEACIHLHRSIHQIKKFGARAGVAINPHTPVSALEEIAADADMFLIMTVNPGFGGQSFIPSSLEKVARLKELLNRKNSNALIQVDGGVNTSNALELKKAGVDVIVVGSAIFNSNNPLNEISKYKNI